MKTFNIKPIETNYKGYLFRSRLEARWAYYFDIIGLEWGYETEGYELPKGIRYLPDFFIKEFGYIEIKGVEPNNEEKEKCRLLSLKDCYVAIMIDLPEHRKSHICYYQGEQIMNIYFDKNTVSKWGQTPFFGDYPYFDDDDESIFGLVKAKRFER